MQRSQWRMDKKGQKRKHEETEEKEGEEDLRLVKASKKIGKLASSTHPSSVIKKPPGDGNIEAIFNVDDELNPIAQEFLQIQQKLYQSIRGINDSYPFVYFGEIKLADVFKRYRHFIAEYCTSECPILFLGINPGHRGQIYTRKNEKLFWILMKRIQKNRDFSNNFFVYNFFPFKYSVKKGHTGNTHDFGIENKEQKRQISEAFRRALLDVLTLLKTRVIVAVGRDMENLAKRSLETNNEAGIKDVTVEYLTHPHLRIRKNCEEWLLMAAKRFKEIDIVGYLTNETQTVDDFISKMEIKVQEKKVSTK